MPKEYFLGNGNYHDQDYLFCYSNKLIRSNSGMLGSVNKIADIDWFNVKALLFFAMCTSFNTSALWQFVKKKKKK